MNNKTYNWKEIKYQCSKCDGEIEHTFGEEAVNFTGCSECDRGGWNFSLTKKSLENGIHGVGVLKI